MDEKALKIVRDYIFAHLDKTDTVPPFDVYMVWKCKALQNWKYLISSTLCDGMYYELTYNGDKKETRRNGILMRTRSLKIRSLKNSN